MDNKTNIEIENFIKWYKKIEANKKYDDIDIEKNTKIIRKLIDKLAIWYELRYPDYVIDHIINLYNGNSVEYNSNISINGNKIQVDEFHDYLNMDIFLNIISTEEKKLLEDPKYKSVYLDAYKSRFKHFEDAYLYVKTNGIIYLPYNISDWSNELINDKELENIHIIDAYKLFKKRGIKLENFNTLQDELSRYRREKLKKDGILNCVLSKIINYNNYGNVRGYLFSKEFNLDNNNINDEDKDLYEFIYNYIKNDKKRLYQRLVYALKEKNR